MNKVIYYIFAFSISILNGNTLNIFYVSIPKCGNFLLKKCLSLITNKQIIPSYNRLFLNEKQISQLNNNNILDSHAFFNKKNFDLMKKYKLQGFFIYRDPRDQIVSFIFYIYKISRDKKLFKNNLKEFNKLDFDQLFFKIINNYDVFYKIWNINHNILPERIGTIPNKHMTIELIYNKYHGWKDFKYIYVTTFEKLIGSKGGGSDIIQLKEIKQIAKHINIHLSDSEAKYIAQNLFGGTYTFREGQIGSWKKYFKQEHKDQFKKIAGNLLIKLGYEKDLNW